MNKVNYYIIHDADVWSCIIYYAIAKDEDQVRELAEKEGYDIEGCEIELVRTDVRDELRRPVAPKIAEALVH